MRACPGRNSPIFPSRSMSTLREATTAYKGRPTNASRVSILTGLTPARSEDTKRQVGEHRITEGSAKLTAAARVLSAWHQNPKYQNAGQLPIQIPIEGPEPSFECLASKNMQAMYPLTALIKGIAYNRVCRGNPRWPFGCERAVTTCRHNSTIRR